MPIMTTSVAPENNTHPNVLSRDKMLIMTMSVAPEDNTPPSVLASDNVNVNVPTRQYTVPSSKETLDKMVIIIKVFIKHKIVSIETILSMCTHVRTHTHTHTHTHTEATAHMNILTVQSSIYTVQGYSQMSNLSL